MTSFVAIDPASAKPQAVAWRGYTMHSVGDSKEWSVCLQRMCDIRGLISCIPRKEIVVCEGGYVGPNDRDALALEHARGRIHEAAHAAGLKFYTVAVSTWQNACLCQGKHMPRGRKALDAAIIFFANDICGQELDVDRATAVCIAYWAECNRVIVEEGAE